MASQYPPDYRKSSSAKSDSSVDKSTNKISDKEQEIDLSYMGSRDEIAATRSPASRQRLRDQMEGDVDVFLSRGGTISQIGRNVTADPPKRPVTHYGQRPI